jgi:hypothetical protein
MSTDRSASPPSLALVLVLLAWAAVVYVAYAVSYLD